MCLGHLRAVHLVRLKPGSRRHMALRSFGMARKLDSSSGCQKWSMGAVSHMAPGLLPHNPRQGYPQCLPLDHCHVFLSISAEMISASEGGPSGPHEHVAQACAMDCVWFVG